MTATRARRATRARPAAPPAPNVNSPAGDLPRALHQIADAAAWARLHELDEVAAHLEFAARTLMRKMAGRR